LAFIFKLLKTLCTEQTEVYMSQINSTNVYKTDTEMRTFQSVDKNYEISS